MESRTFSQCSMSQCLKHSHTAATLKELDSKWEIGEGLYNIIGFKIIFQQDTNLH